MDGKYLVIKYSGTLARDRAILQYAETNGFTTRKNVAQA